MALFPRRVGGRYVALSRWDRENNAVCTSADGRRWGDAAHAAGARAARGSSLQTRATAARRWRPTRAGSCSPTASAPCASTPSAPCCSTWTTRRRVLGALREPLAGARRRRARRLRAQRRLLLRRRCASATGCCCPTGSSDAAVRFAFVDLAAAGRAAAPRRVSRPRRGRTAPRSPPPCAAAVKRRSTSSRQCRRRQRADGADGVHRARHVVDEEPGPAVADDLGHRTERDARSPACRWPATRPPRARTARRTRSGAAGPARRPAARPARPARPGPRSSTSGDPRCGCTRSRK